MLGLLSSRQMLAEAVSEGPGGVAGLLSVVGTSLRAGTAAPIDFRLSAASLLPLAAAFSNHDLAAS